MATTNIHANRLLQRFVVSGVRTPQTFTVAAVCQSNRLFTSSTILPEAARTTTTWNRGPAVQRRFVQSSTGSISENFKNAKDFVPLMGFDHVEFYCSNALQASHYYSSMFGFKPVAYCGLETGNKTNTTVALEQGNIKLLVTAPLTDVGIVADHVKKHGDGVRTVALTVADARKAYDEVLRRGATSHSPPTVLEDAEGKAVVASIHAYADTIHTFVERHEYKGNFLPGFRAFNKCETCCCSSREAREPPVGLLHIDHAVTNVPKGDMNNLAKFYRDTFGMADLVTFDDKDISTQYTALMSKVVTNGAGTVKLPINEPADGLKKSQIQEYLDFYKASGVQHLALVTNDIVASVRNLRFRGCRFLHVPGSYYDTVEERCGKIDEDLAVLKELGNATCAFWDTRM
eukprot:GHVT01001037.1.p1 GENE.GHVT01001037.1~~GHVT01001037.1.p1  ORF type:complete len:402 (+),score=41.88 GHVT01001037.1:3962-5167(+)